MPYSLRNLRSNLVWMDRMSVFVDEKDCKEMPKLTMTKTKNMSDFGIITMKGGFDQNRKNLENFT